MECLSGFLRSSIAELTITGRNGILMQKRSATAVGDSGFTLMQNTQENEKLWEHDASKLCEHDASKPWEHDAPKLCEHDAPKAVGARRTKAV